MERSPAPRIGRAGIDGDRGSRAILSRRPRRAAAAACAALSAACGVDEATFDNVQNRVFNVNCTTVSCHSQGRQAGNLSLVRGDAYAALVNVDPFNEVAKGKGYQRVVPEDPARSFLYIKVTAPAAGEGDRMPQLGQLAGEKVDLIKRWIEMGAAP